MLHGLGLRAHLERFGVDEFKFLHHLTGSRSLRWGNTLDIAVAADLWNCRIQLLDMAVRGAPILVDTGGEKTPLCMGFGNSHFYVVKRTCRVRPVRPAQHQTSCSLSAELAQDSPRLSLASMCTGVAGAAQ
eukprot:4991930-Amphidinium_carterae.1